MRILLVSVLFACNLCNIFGQEDVTSVINNSVDHTIFSDLLKFTGIEEMLEEDGFYSVFAPSDETLSTVIGIDVIDSLKFEDPEVLSDLVMRHIVEDTLHVDYISEPYLPLKGSHIRLFVDAANNIFVLVSGRDRLYDYPRFKYPFHDDNYYAEADNGIIFWLEKEVIRPSECLTMNDLIEVVGEPLYSAINAINLYDSLRMLSGDYSFVIPNFEEALSSIEANGGFNDTPFLDSFVRRHILANKVILQETMDGFEAENLLGEQLVFNKKGSDYFLNAQQIELFIDNKGVSSFQIKDYVDSPITANRWLEMEDISIFPNPCNSHLKVYLPLNHGNGVVKVLSLDGSLVTECTFTNADLELTIDLNHYQEGMYFLQLNAHNQVLTKNFLISKL